MVNNFVIAKQQSAIRCSFMYSCLLGLARLGNQCCMRLIMMIACIIIITNMVLKNLHPMLHTHTFANTTLSHGHVMHEELINRSDFSLYSSNKPLLADIFAFDGILTVVINIVGYSADRFEKSTWKIFANRQITEATSVVRCRDGHTLVIKFQWLHTVHNVTVVGSTNTHAVRYVGVPVATLFPTKHDMVACTMINLNTMHTDAAVALRLIKEWVAYHLIQGFDHFVIYCNRDFVTVSEYFIGWRQYVSVLDWEWPHAGFQHQQAQQTSCIHRFRKRANWVALMDVDEFFQPLVPGKTVKDIVVPLYSSDLGAIDVVSHVFQKQQPAEQHISLINRFWQTFQPNDDLWSYVSYFLHSPETANISYNISNETYLVTQTWLFQSSHRGHHKCIVIPENVDTFSVHSITAGKKTLRANHETTLRVNHYRYNCLFCQGVFQLDLSMLQYGPTLVSYFNMPVL